MIRKLEQKDRALYLEMTQEMYHSNAVLHPIPAEYCEKTFEELMRSEQYAFGFLIEYQERPAGYALLAKTFSQEAGGMVIWIEEIYIRPEFRSKGLGKEFFAYLHENMDESVVRLRLETEFENTKAKKLYANLGFEELEYAQMVKDLII